MTMVDSCTNPSQRIAKVPVEMRVAAIQSSSVRKSCVSMKQSRQKFVLDRYRPQKPDVFCEAWDRLELVLALRTYRYEWWDTPEEWHEDAWFRWDGNIYVGVRESSLGESYFYVMVPSVGDERWRDYFLTTEWSLEYLLDAFEARALAVPPEALTDEPDSDPPNLT